MKVNTEGQMKKNLDFTGGERVAPEARQKHKERNYLGFGVGSQHNAQAMSVMYLV